MSVLLSRAYYLMVDRPAISSLVLGLVAATGYPPLGLWPFTILALAAFITLLQGAQNLKQAAWWGWLFGWAHLSLSNNWIATAFTYQAEMPPALGWLAVPLLCIYLAVYPALAAVGTHFVTGLMMKRFQMNPPGLTSFAALFGALWIVTEWLRSWVFTGYPWPPLGLVFLGDFTRPGLAMLLPWIGTYALSGFVIIIAGLLAALVVYRHWILVVALGTIVASGMFLPALQQLQPGNVRFALIQPLIPQTEMDDPRKFEEQYARIAELTAPGRGDRRLVLWPESSLPDYLEDGYPQRYYVQMTAGGDPAFARRRLGALIGEDSLLLAGLIHLDIGERGGRRAAVSARNAVSVINPAGELEQTYVKAHLVPYGEYLPMREILEPLGLSRLVPGSIDYAEGPGPQTLDLDRFGRAGIQVCYEIVFSGQVVDRENRPDYIFNPSNDGWFGAWGPPQHLAQARLRALEEGLPVLRSTTTGISGVIDARGVVRGYIGQGKADRIDGFIPPPAEPTWFARLGNILPLSWALLIALLSLVVMYRRSV
ncbi:apolipoprotein N-acyltransferase [Altererythrobacter sp. GH1-8]|uniref:apolipoprotein N-acyltransferase n=1 Tax=Altererythrobacter sp. GH1-8 TaxID=3349333 RepID=UPI00374D38F4